MSYFGGQVYDNSRPVVVAHSCQSLELVAVVATPQTIRLNIN